MDRGRSTLTGLHGHSGRSSAQVAAGLHLHIDLHKQVRRKRMVDRQSVDKRVVGLGLFLGRLRHFGREPQETNCGDGPSIEALRPVQVHHDVAIATPRNLPEQHTEDKVQQGFDSAHLALSIKLVKRKGLDRWRLVESSAKWQPARSLSLHSLRRFR